MHKIAICELPSPVPPVTPDLNSFDCSGHTPKPTSLWPRGSPTPARPSPHTLPPWPASFPISSTSRPPPCWTPMLRRSSLLCRTVRARTTSSSYGRRVVEWWTSAPTSGSVTPRTTSSGTAKPTTTRPYSPTPSTVWSNVTATNCPAPHCWPSPGATRRPRHSRWGRFSTVTSLSVSRLWSTP